MFDYAKVGAAVMSQNAYAKVERPFPNYQGHRPAPAPHHQPATTGWTAPTLIYDKMRQVNMSAMALNGDIGANVRRELFKGSWASWFANWRAFFEKYQGTMARLGALTYTDELFQQVLSFESQLVSWYDAYGREKDGDRPVPPPSGAPPVPNAPIPPARDRLPEAPPGDGLVIPWWAWLIGAGVIGGAGYMTYRYVKRAQAIRTMLDEKVVPQVLSVYGGPAGGQLAAGYGEFAAAARDPRFVMTPGAGHMHAVAPSGVVSQMPIPYSRYPGY